MLGIDYTIQKLIWVGITIFVGIIFALPAILGYSTIKWVDYLAVPAGLFILGVGIWLAIQAHGLGGISAWNPPQKIPWSLVISTIIGVNVCQWVMIADYSRYCKPKLRDTLLMPIGIVLVGLALMFAGSIMSIGIEGFDIIQVMVKLGFPLWAFLLLWFAQWTSQMSNVYTPGLALSNMFNLKTHKGRATITFLAALIGLVLALAGILDLFQDFLLILGIVFPPVGAIIATDFFILRKQKWKDIPGWNWVATLAMVIGIFLGYYTQYLNPIGIPAIQSYLTTSILYYAFMRAKGKVYPDNFTPKHWIVKKETV
jgi:cytosine permease